MSVLANGEFRFHLAPMRGSFGSVITPVVSSLVILRGARANQVGNQKDYNQVFHNALLLVRFYVYLAYRTIKTTPVLVRPRYAAGSRACEVLLSLRQSISRALSFLFPFRRLGRGIRTLQIDGQLVDLADKAVVSLRVIRRRGGVKEWRSIRPLAAFFPLMKIVSLVGMSRKLLQLADGAKKTHAAPKAGKLPACTEFV
jgi:hypothetical protein